MHSSNLNKKDICYLSNAHVLLVAPQNKSALSTIEEEAEYQK